VDLSRVSAWNNDSEAETLHKGAWGLAQKTASVNIKILLMLPLGS